MERVVMDLVGEEEDDDLFLARDGRLVQHGLQLLGDLLA